MITGAARLAPESALHPKRIAATYQSGFSEGRDMKSKLVCGIGINDADYKVRTADWFCPFYQRWYGMLTRCYGNRIQASYRDCSVCDEWLTFSKFKRWMERQDWHDKQLDKDIIKPGNRVYSPEACIFVSRKDNTSALHQRVRANNKTGVNGVGFHKGVGKYRARIKINGKENHIGWFSTIKEAKTARLEAEKNLA